MTHPIYESGVDEALRYFFEKKTGFYDSVERSIYLMAFDDLSKKEKYYALEIANKLFLQWKTNIKDQNEFTVTRAACIYMEERVIPTLEGRLDRRFTPEWVVDILFK
jgi:hypothetical protein